MIFFYDAFNNLEYSSLCVIFPRVMFSGLLVSSSLLHSLSRPCELEDFIVVLNIYFTDGSAVISSYCYLKYCSFLYLILFLDFILPFRACNIF